MSALNFGLAITIGRGVRYFGEGLLALWYGEQAIAFLHDHGRLMFLVVLGVVLGLWGARHLWKRTRQRA